MKKYVSTLTVIFLSFLVLVACLGEEVKKDTTPPKFEYEGQKPSVQKPMSPEDSEKLIEVPEGFHVKLFAAEPNIVNPIGMCWDERGRLYVLESVDYPHHFPHTIESKKGNDRITICEDTNGDGRADKFTLFADHLSLSTGIVKIKGGILVAMAPNMIYLEDTDGDDKFDKHKILFKGFGLHDTHAGPSSLAYGADNHIWGTVGYSGFNWNTGKTKGHGRMGVFRFSQDGQTINWVGGFNNNTWGLGQTEDGEVFGSTANNNHIIHVNVPYEFKEYAADGVKLVHNIQSHYEVKHISTTTPQQVDVRNGYTAAAGARIYTARKFPKKYWNKVAFICEPTAHVVHNAVLEVNGSSYKESKVNTNIFASRDDWTAPVAAEVGPDGQLWIADWYNPVIQHNPDGRTMKNQIWNDNGGKGNAHQNPRRDKKHGRIYRVIYGEDKGVTSKSLAKTSSKKLVDSLSDDNMLWRLTAQRLIVDRKDKSVVSELNKLASNKKLDELGFNIPASHALYTLNTLGILNPELVQTSLKHPAVNVRKTALDIMVKNKQYTNMLKNSGLSKDKNQRLAFLANLKLNSFLGKKPDRVLRYINHRKRNLKLLMISGGSHQFLLIYGQTDAQTLKDKATIAYTENPAFWPNEIKDSAVLMISNNKGVPGEARKAIFEHVSKGKALMINHPATWYNWRDWPEYNLKIVGGGATSHEPLRKFKVVIKDLSHPMMKGLPESFEIIDELYRWAPSKEKNASRVKVLVEGHSLKTGKVFPVVWTVEREGQGRIVCNTLGHDMRAHTNKDYKILVRNTLEWALQKGPDLHQRSSKKLSEADKKFIEAGKKTYVTTCIVCHGKDGKGVKNQKLMLGAPMIKSKRVLGDKKKLIRIIMDGLSGPIDGKTYGMMPPNRVTITDDEKLAQVISYIRNNKDWGHNGGVVSKKEVSAIRELDKARGKAGKFWTLEELK